MLNSRAVASAAVHPCSPKHLLNFSSGPPSDAPRRVLSTHLSSDFRSFANTAELKHLLPVTLLFTSARSHSRQLWDLVLKQSSATQTWAEKRYQVKLKRRWGLNIAKHVKLMLQKAWKRDLFYSVCGFLHLRRRVCEFMNSSGYTRKIFIDIL